MARPPSHELTHAHVLVFRMLRDAAKSKHRCPMAHEIAKLLEDKDVAGDSVQITGDLSRAGYITTRVYSLNWRTVEIMVGPHKGAVSLLPSHRHGKAHMVCDRLPSRPIPTAEPVMPAGEPKHRAHRSERKPPVIVRDQRVPRALPVRTDGFIAPPTKEQLMGRR